MTLSLYQQDRHPHTACIETKGEFLSNLASHFDARQSTLKKNQPLTDTTTVRKMEALYLVYIESRGEIVSNLASHYPSSHSARLKKCTLFFSGSVC